MFITTKNIRERIENILKGTYVSTNSIFSINQNLFKETDIDAGSIENQNAGASDRKFEVLAGEMKPIQEINHFDGFGLYESDFTVKISYFYTHLGNDLVEVLNSESGTGYLKDINDRANHDKFNIEKTLTWIEAFSGVSPEVFKVVSTGYNLNIQDDKVISEITFNIQFQVSLIEGFNASFLPSDISNLYAWYKYDSLLLVSSSTRVSAAFDKSGNGRDAVQPTGSYQPYYSGSGGLQNKPYFRLTSSLTYGTGLFAGTKGEWDFLHNGSPYTVVLIAKTGGNNWGWMIGTQPSSVANNGFAISSTITPGNQLSITMGNGSANTARIGYDGLVIDPNLYHKYIVYFSSQSSILNDSLFAKIDNKTYSTAQIRPLNTASNNQYFGIGFGSDGRYPTNTNIHEVIIFNKRLNGDEINKVEMYLNKEYGL